MLKLEGNGCTYYELEAEEFSKMCTLVNIIALCAEELFEIVPETAAPHAHELIKNCTLIRDWMDDNITPKERKKADLLLSKKAKLLLNSAYGLSVGF